jgi:hypothetical protein
MRRKKYCNSFKRKKIKLLKALEDRKREKEKAVRQAAAYFRRLSENVRIHAGVLYGSYARGDFNTGSDIDLMVIAEELPGHPLDRWELLYSCATGGIEPKGYTASEFMKLVEKKNPFALELLSCGVPLLDSGFWAPLTQQTNQRR